MIPDKIFIDGDLITSLVLQTKYDWDIEYIRKDALLEWAKNLKDRWEEPPMSKHSPGCVFMLEQVIKKIESL